MTCQMIPKVIHTFWFQGGGIPDVYAKNIEKIKALNSDWKYNLWDDSGLREHCAKFGEDVLKCYDAFPYMHQKIDFGRLIVLYFYGGISVDMDVTAHKPFDLTPGIDHANFIVSKSSRSRLEMMVFSKGRLSSAYNNAMLLCEPRSQYIAALIREIYRVSCYRSFFVYYTIQWTTGPFMLSTILNDELDNAADATVLPSYYFEHAEYHPSAILSHHHENTWLPRWFKFIKKYIVTVLTSLS